MMYLLSLLSILQAHQQLSVGKVKFNSVSFLFVLGCWFYPFSSRFSVLSHVWHYYWLLDCLPFLLLLRVLIVSQFLSVCLFAMTHRDKSKWKQLSITCFFVLLLFVILIFINIFLIKYKRWFNCLSVCSRKNCLLKLLIFMLKMN